MGDIWDLPACAQVKSVSNQDFYDNINLKLQHASVTWRAHNPGLAGPGVSMSVPWVWAGSTSAFLTSSLGANSWFGATPVRLSLSAQRM